MKIRASNILRSILQLILLIYWHIQLLNSNPRSAALEVEPGTYMVYLEPTRIDGK
jgi:hypothetical protein